MARESRRIRAPPSSADLSSAQVKISGGTAGDYFGYAVQAPGDFDGDGREDLLVTAPYDDDGGTDAGVVFLASDNGSAPGAGAVWLLYGPLAGTYDLGTTSDYDARFLGNGASDACGAAVGVGDLDADGADEMLMGCVYGDVGVDAGRGTVSIFAGGSVPRKSRPA